MARASVPSKGPDMAPITAHWRRQKVLTCHLACGNHIRARSLLCAIDVLNLGDIHGMIVMLGVMGAVAALVEEAFRLDVVGVERPARENQARLFECGRVIEEERREPHLGNFVAIAAAFRSKHPERALVLRGIKRERETARGIDEALGVALRANVDRYDVLPQITPMPPQLTVMVLKPVASPAVTSPHSVPMSSNGLMLRSLMGIS